MSSIQIHLIDRALQEMHGQQEIDSNYDPTDSTGYFDFTDKPHDADHAVFMHDNQLNLCFLSVRKAQPDDGSEAEVVAEIGTESPANSASSSAHSLSPNPLQTQWQRGQSSLPQSSSVSSRSNDDIADEIPSITVNDGHGSDALEKELIAAMVELSSEESNSPASASLSGNNSPTGADNPAALADPPHAASASASQRAPERLDIIALTREDTVAPEAPVPRGEKRPLNVSSGSSNSSPTQAGPSTKRVHVENPEPAGPASASTSTHVVFTPKVRRAINNIVNSLLRWDQDAGRAAIEPKLGAVSTELEQMVLISQLGTRLASATNKLDEINAWADTVTVGDIVAAAVDTRTPTERRLQEHLTAQMRIPDFNQAFEDIFNMIPGRKVKERIRATTVRSGRYYSPLLNRIFDDSRGPLVAIQAIRDHLQTQIDSARHQALLDWEPQKN